MFSWHIYFSLFMLFTLFEWMDYRLLFFSFKIWTAVWGWWLFLYFYVFILLLIRFSWMWPLNWHDFDPPGVKCWSNPWPKAFSYNLQYQWMHLSIRRVWRRLNLTFSFSLLLPWRRWFFSVTSSHFSLQTTACELFNQHHMKTTLTSFKLWQMRLLSDQTKERETHKYPSP